MRAGSLLLLCVLAAQGALTELQRELNLVSFEHVWTTVRDKHWDPKLGGIDWAAARDEFRPRVEQAQSMSEARAAMAEMMARLGQSHFAIVPAEIYSEEGQGGAGTTGLDVRIIGGLAVVSDVSDGSPAAAAGVRRGWQLARVGGQEIEAPLRKVLETGKEVLAIHYVLRRLSGAPGSALALDFLDGAGRPVKVTLSLAGQQGVKTTLGLLPPMYVWSKFRKEGNTGYFRFNLFFDPPVLMGAFGKAVEACLACDGFIVDLRGNPGGIGGMAMGMSGWFIGEADPRLGVMHLRGGTLKFAVNPRLPLFTGPLAILIDGASGSTSEILAGGLKDLKRARIFGSRSAGMALPSVFEKLVNGDGFQYAIANYISEGGQPLEGIGVIPDEEVKLTRAALLEGRDEALEAALQWIRKQKRN